MRENELSRICQIALRIQLKTIPTSWANSKFTQIKMARSILKAKRFFFSPFQNSILVKKFEDLLRVCFYNIIFSSVFSMKIYVFTLINQLWRLKKEKKTNRGDWKKKLQKKAGRRFWGFKNHQLSSSRNHQVKSVGVVSVIFKWYLSIGV